MNITLTFKDKLINTQNDIRIDSCQKIIDTINILQESGLVEYRDKYRVKSIRSSTYINTLLNYDEANIYNGDILIII